MTARRTLSMAKRMEPNFRPLLRKKLLHNSRFKITLLFLGDEHNNTNMKRDHRNSFVEKCDSKCRMDRISYRKKIIPRKYQDYDHVPSSWSQRNSTVQGFVWPESQRM
jgi:hypothetical protein